VIDLAAGDAFPDIELDDHAGNRRSLSELVAGDPTVLHFYRGWWCPKEQTFMRMLVALQDELEVAYARIVSVSIDPPHVAAAWRAGVGARWTFLSDPEREAQSRLGLLETTDTVYRPYLPTVFMLSPEGLEIENRYDGYWYLGRPTADELRRDLRAIASRIREDWDGPAR
jgi:peroxiredoxin